MTAQREPDVTSSARMRLGNQAQQSVPSPLSRSMVGFPAVPPRAERDTVLNLAAVIINDSICHG
jgi:hypothetical protein